MYDYVETMSAMIASLNHDSSKQLQINMHLYLLIKNIT